MVAKSSRVTPSFVSFVSEWVVERRIIVITLGILLTTLAAYGVRFLELSTSYRILFDPENPQLIALESLEDTYGKSDSVIFLLVPDNGDALSQNAIDATFWLTEQAWQTPFSTRVDSITNFQHTRAEGDDLYVEDLLQPQMLNDADALEQARKIALSDTRLVGKLIDVEGSVSVVLVSVAMQEDADISAISETADFARDIAALAESTFEGMDVRLAGSVIINQEFAQAAVNSQKVFLPLSLFVMIVFLVIMTRGAMGVLSTGIVMIFSVLVSLGMGGWVGLIFSPSTAPASTIVLMIVVANCVHILVTIQQRLAAGDMKLDAIKESVRVNLQPVFLASFTTALGFLSMNFAEVPPHRHLGTFVAFGLIASFFLSVTFLPAFMSLLPLRANKALMNNDPLMTKLSSGVLKYQKILLVGSALVVTGLTVLIPRNELNDVFTHFFSKRVEFRQDIDLLDDRLGANGALEYSLVSGQNIADPKFLTDVEAFATWYREQPAVRNVSVITDTFKQINKSLHGDDPGSYQLPATTELGMQYLLLYELSLPAGLDLNNQVSLDKMSTRLTVSTSTLSSNEMLALNESAKQWLSDNAPNIIEAQGSGPALLFSHIAQRNIKSMLIGTALALAGISAVLVLAFRSLGLGLVSLIPNFIPILSGFGIWGLASGEVGSALSIVAAMTIGIVVDDTVHFLSKYRRARRELGLDPEQAVTYSFQTVGRAIFMTTIVLLAGFLIFVLSPFVPTAQVGLLTAIIIAAAMLCDYLTLPPLLIAVDRFMKIERGITRVSRKSEHVSQG